MAQNPWDDKLQELQQRVERLERWTGIAGWNPTPNFDPVLFDRALRQSFRPLLVVFVLVMVLWFAVTMFLIPNAAGASVLQSRLFGLPSFAEGFSGTDYPVSLWGVPVAIFAVNGIGLVSFGSAGLGVIACGGFAVGIVAIGGGAIGVISFGGGSLGVISLGGGAIGHIAMGGGAIGRYVLAGEGKGRFVFDRRRQDPQAVQFFCRWFPHLRQAFHAEVGP